MKTPWNALILLATVLIAGLIFIFVFERQGENHAPEPELWLKTYQLPAGYAPKIRDVINNTINVGKASSDGRAEILPDGRLAVYGTPFIQSGVESIIKQLQTNQELLSRNVRFDFWVLFSNLDKPDAYPALPDHLNAVCRANGLENVRVYQRLSLMTCDGTWASTKSLGMKLSARFTYIGESIRTELELSGPAQLETQLNLKSGQVMLVGQAGLNPKIFEIPEQKGNGQVIYLLETQTLD
ncbi:MAG: hypothetical protein H6510_09350 [Acidobacteria bacterium]|nr:hypothetical protein [Acidobacteriota bacterium]MCB9398010.1 hypothetical protein [Acidobacteriota bacterium]